MSARVIGGVRVVQWVRPSRLDFLDRNAVRAAVQQVVEASDTLGLDADHDRATLTARLLFALGVDT